jgi:hypothetical protein
MAVMPTVVISVLPKAPVSPLKREVMVQSLLRN